VVNFYYLYDYSPSGHHGIPQEASSCAWWDLRGHPDFYSPILDEVALTIPPLRGERRGRKGKDYSRDRMGWWKVGVPLIGAAVLFEDPRKKQEGGYCYSNIPPF
jgi:hypothetical protein